MWCPFLGVETDTISHTFRLRLNSRRDSETSNSLNSIAAHDYQFKGMQSQQKEASFNFGLNKTAESHPEHRLSVDGAMAGDTYPIDSSLWWKMEV